MDNLMVTPNHISPERKGLPVYCHQPVTYCNPNMNKTEACNSPTSVTAVFPGPGCCLPQPTLCYMLPLSYNSSLATVSSIPVYDAYPTDDPNAYEGAIVIRPGVSSQGICASSSTKKHPVDSSSPQYQFACCYAGCDFICEAACEMREHFKDHPGKHQYRCLHPGCTFVSSVLKDMTYHRGYHTGERPFLCDYPNCGFAAPNQSQLRLHRVSHSNDKPYKCSFSNCLYVTQYKSALINHERTHTGEKPYKCKYCKAFSAKQKSGLQYHIRTVHMSK